MNRSLMLDVDMLTLRSFLAIIDRGSFSAAAEYIGRTQSAVSVQISRLEERMQVSLFERTSRNVTLTPEGETFASYVRKIIALADEGFAAVTALESAEPLRLGIAEYIVPKHLKGILAQIKGSIPKSKVTLKLGMGFDLYKDLREGSLDIIITGPEGDDGIQLLSEPLVWAGSLPDESEEGSLNIVQMKAPCSYRKAAVESLNNAGYLWNEEVSVNNIQGILSAVEAGFGITALPKSAVEPGMIIVSDNLPELSETGIYLYWNRSNPHSLTDHCIKIFKEKFREIG